jgi:hypothetical protein
MLFKSAFTAAAVAFGVLASPVAHAQSTPLKPFPILGKTDSASNGMVKISVSYQFFLEGDTRSMENQAGLADQGRKHVYILLAKECVVLKETIAETCAIERANVNAQLRNANRRQTGVRISGSATYRIALKKDQQAPKN